MAIGKKGGLRGKVVNLSLFEPRSAKVHVPIWDESSGKVSPCGSNSLKARILEYEMAQQFAKVYPLKWGKMFLFDLSGAEMFRIGDEAWRGISFLINFQSPRVFVVFVTD